MPQLLVRDIDIATVRRLKRRAAEHGVSAEEEHRRILKAALAQAPKGKPNLIEHLLSEEGSVLPKVELDLRRNREIENRDLGF